MPIRTEPVLPEDDWQLRLDPPTDGSGIGTLTLDYPEKLNMWSWEATRQLGALADRARFDDRIRVLVVKAEGRAFFLRGHRPRDARGPGDGPIAGGEGAQLLRGLALGARALPGLPRAAPAPR